MRSTGRTHANELIVACFVVICALNSSDANVQTERDDKVNAFVGATTTLQCRSSTNQDVDWKYQRTLTSEPEFVYSNGLVYDVYQSRFTINKTSPHDYMLTIRDVQYNDSGLYACIEETGYGDRHITQLTVTHANEETTTDYKLNAFVGTTATLQCHSSLDEDIDWKYQLNLTSEPKFVYSNGYVYDVYQSRFTINKTSPHDYMLIIRDVQYNDSGLYVCIEEAGYGDKHITELNVTDVTPDIESGINVSLAIILSLGIICVIGIILIPVLIALRSRYSNRSKQNVADSSSGLLRTPAAVKT